jgi:hypothetical protein
MARNRQQPCTRVSGCSKGIPSWFPPVTFTHSNSDGTAFPALSDYLRGTADKELERLARGETRRAKKGEGEHERTREN